jgi:pimeloyl-ACP methyl ester carboxylesterase
MQTEWKQEETQVGDLTVHYARSYTAGGAPLVLAHGFSDSGMCWLPAAQALAVEYDVILPDARGHGLSSRVQPDSGAELDLAADLAGFIRALALERPVVGGHSMGAGTAAEMEARFPGLASALILEDPPWRALPVEEKPPAAPANTWMDWLNTYHNRSLEEVIEHGRQLNPNWDAAEFPAWAASKQQFDPNFVTARSRILRPDFVDLVRAITIPALLITADPEKGAIVTPEVAEQVVDANPLIQVAHIHGAGHNIRREAFTEFMDAVRGFLGALPKE